MLMDERVTRRSFLRGLLTAAAGAGLNSFIPLPIISLKAPVPGSGMQAYWLDVLSRGVRYFPDNIVSFYSDWSDIQLKASAHHSLLLSLGQNRQALSSPRLPGDREMDEAVERNKSTQYLYESLRIVEADESGGEGALHTDDPLYARLLHDLSSFILRDTMDRVEDASFSGFVPFDITLLDSCLSYVRKAISLNEDVLALCEEPLREAIKVNMGSCFNNLGLALSYLGEVQQAQEAFGKALELRPDNRAILRNLQDMDANGLIVRRRLYSRTLVE